MDDHSPCRRRLEKHGLVLETGSDCPTAPRRLWDECTEACPCRGCRRCGRCRRRDCPGSCPARGEDGSRRENRSYCPTRNRQCLPRMLLGLVCADRSTSEAKMADVDVEVGAGQEDGTKIERTCQSDGDGDR